MNVILIALTQNVINKYLVSEENETKYLGACSYECAKHERNRYVQANNISDNEWQQRLTNFDDLHQHA